ncbi:hypothetical protein MSIMFI_05346 [Mycobacterium simulans]|nr:hypothetical protein MSIMFI_05346 [Mycobacterium simulans]
MSGADAARSAGADQPSSSAVAGDAAGAGVAAGPAGAVEPSTAAAGATFTADAAGTGVAAGPAVADEPGGPAAAARPAGYRWGIAVAAVAVEQSTGPTVGVGGRAVGAVADQRAAQQRLGMGVDHAQRVLPQGLQLRGGGSLDCRIRLGASIQRLHKLGVKHRRLHAQRLIFVAVGAKQPCDRCRHLIFGGGQHPCR